jgi:hypothetical protein
MTSEYKKGSGRSMGERAAPPFSLQGALAMGRTPSLEESAEKMSKAMGQVRQKVVFIDAILQFGNKLANEGIKGEIVIEPNVELFNRVCGEMADLIVPGTSSPTDDILIHTYCGDIRLRNPYKEKIKEWATAVPDNIILSEN